MLAEKLPLFLKQASQRIIESKDQKDPKNADQSARSPSREGLVVRAATTICVQNQATRTARADQAGDARERG